ncbi:Tannase/feruloyl esterase [Diaporthe sp. PMI_573]|nr:Tannase/feruloyl esterase [Diaporthaceae sp. PMI_573]
MSIINSPSETFSFPELLGAQLSSIKTSVLDGYKGGSGWPPEAALIGPDGVRACNVTVSYTHPGHDDLVFVQVWLPLANFNKRFVGVGGGGWSAGEPGTDLRSALASQGYAVATTNAGYNHDLFGTADSWLMKSPGNLNYPLIVNFGHRALHDMAVIAKHIVREAYGSGPEFSYWQGCSTGGRQGLTIARKYPNDYDGILTSCPAINFPALLMAMYWPQFVMNQRGTYPRPCEFEAIRAGVLESCDGLDGVKDGMIARPDLCNFDPMTLVGNPFNCDGSSTVVSEDAVDLFKTIVQGPVDLEGNQLYTSIMPGTALVGLMATANTLCSSKHCSRGLPFTISDDWIRLMVAKDPSFDPAEMSHMDYAHLFRESVTEWDAMFSSSNPDMDQFRQLGKKMLSWHSLNDEAVPVLSVRKFYEKVLARDQANNITTQDYYRYFEVPGATHCSAPAGVPYPLNALRTLESWVEDGVVPEELPAVLLGQEQSTDIPRVHILSDFGNSVT